MIKNQTTTHKILIITLLLSLFILLTSVSGVHAAKTVYVNATGGNDSNDGSIDHPYQTIDQAMKNVDVNGTVKIADGTYKGKGNVNLTISKNMNFIGQHQKKTIINGENSTQVFIIDKGVTVTLQNLTITNGTGIISNSSFYLGGAVYNGGTLTVKHCSFISNTGNYAGAIYNDGTLSLKYCTFKNNIAITRGGAIYNGGTLNVSGCIFTDNNAGHDGAAFYNSGITNVNGCTFTGNNACNEGAICTQVNSITTAHFNRFVNNTAKKGNAICCNGGSVDAKYNWWGSNTNPKNIINLIAGKVDNVDSDSWLVLTITPHKNSIDAGGKTVVTVDLLHDCNGVYHDPANGHVPDGTVVTFSASNGTLNPITTELVNGSAVTTLTAKSEGKSIIQATIDNQTVLTEVTVNPVKPTPVDPVKPTPVKPVPVKPDTPNSNDNGTQPGTVHAASTIGLQKTGVPLNGLLLGLIMVFGAFGLRRK